MVAALPFVFVLLWSSAFVSSKFIVEEATPFAALCFRFAIVAVGYAVFARLLGDALRARPADAVRAMLIGVLFHGLYLGGVFYSIDHGLPAGFAALIVNLQPVLTALLARPLLGETVTARQWGGIVLGFGGVVLVLGVELSTELALAAYAAIIIALLAITGGTLWQKRVSDTLPLSVSNMYQAAGAMLFHFVALSLLEHPPRIDFTLQFALSMGWQIVFVSFGAFTTLMYLIKKGDASKTATLFFLVPGVTVIMAWLVADETLQWTSVLGLLVSSAGVYIATRVRG